MNYTNDPACSQAEPDPQARCDAVMKLIWEHAPKTLTIAEAGDLAFKIELLLRNPVGYGVMAETPLGTDCISELTTQPG